MRTDTAWLMGNYVGSALWGMYSTLFLVTMWAVRKQGTDGLRSPAICGVILLYILHLGLTGFFAAKNYEAFITAAEGATAYFKSPRGYMVVVVNDFAMFFSITIADLTLAWRVYIIYFRDVRVLSFVLMLLSGTIISGICGLTYDVLIVTHGPIPYYMRQELRCVAAVVAFTVSFNCTVTGLIVSRLWWASSRIKNTTLFSHYDGVETKPVTHTYQKLIVIMIESGALYTSIWLVFLVAYVMGEPGWNFTVFLIPITPRIVALIPTLIILQRSLGYIQTSESPVAPISNVEFAVISTRPCSPTLLASGTSGKDEFRLSTMQGDRSNAAESIASGVSPSAYSETSHKVDLEEIS